MNWHKTYMTIAKEYAKHSKCAAKQVACILVKDNNIIAVGINGTLPGAENCNERFRKQGGEWFKMSSYRWVKADPDEHHKWSLENETHAEINALAKANKNGVSVQGATAYITHSCCYNCAKALATFGIKEVIYDYEYDDIAPVVIYLKKAGIGITKLSEIEEDYFNAR